MSHLGQPSLDLGESKKIASLVADLGVDLLDVSSGGNNPAQKIEVHPYYQVDLASEIREHLRKEGKKMLIGAVGMITNAEMAKDVVESDGTVEVDGEHGTKAKADLVLVARQYLREPEFVPKVASELGVGVRLPLQYSRAPFPKKKKVEQGKL